jgi:lipopolysaccharide transport protein LptA
MAFSILRACAATAFVCAAALAYAADQPTCTEPTKLNIEGPSEFDFRTGKTIMHHVAISQCDVSVTADRAEATSLDTKASRWTFSGNVHIDAEQRGAMESDQAEIDFRDNRIDKATVRGNPAQFAQKNPTSGHEARGRAREIVYEVGTGTVLFADEAWLTNGETELSGPSCTYNIRQEKVRCQKAKITIVSKPGTEHAASGPANTNQAAEHP